MKIRFIIVFVIIFGSLLKADDSIFIYKTFVLKDCRVKIKNSKKKVFFSHSEKFRIIKSKTTDYQYFEGCCRKTKIKLKHSIFCAEDVKHIYRDSLRIIILNEWKKKTKEVESGIFPKINNVDSVEWELIGGFEKYIFSSDTSNLYFVYDEINNRAYFWFNNLFVVIENKKRNPINYFSLGTHILFICDKNKYLSIGSTGYLPSKLIKEIENGHL